MNIVHINLPRAPLLALLVTLLTTAPTLAQTCNNAVTTTAPDSRYQDHNDGTVNDLQTGLMWQQCSLGQSGNGCSTGNASSFTWDLALQQAEIVNGSGGFAGHSDWRLPNVRELESLLEEACVDPAINTTLFPNTWGNYWSSSPKPYPYSKSWSVDFIEGISLSYPRDYLRKIRLVRSGQ